MNIFYTYLDSIEYSDVAEYESLLPPYRREKIARLRFDSDKLLSLTAGLLIRRAAGDRPIMLNEHGKPYVQDGGVYFSASHSGKCAAIAVDGAEVGFDVEKLPERDCMPIARRFYHPNELKSVEAADDLARAFSRVWTRKEAYLKQLGTGIVADLKAFDTTCDELSRRLHTFELENYVMSVCSSGIIPIEKINIAELELNDMIR